MMGSDVIGRIVLWKEEWLLYKHEFGKTSSIYEWL